MQKTVGFMFQIRLKELSLECKYVFCRPEHNTKEIFHKLNFDVLKMQK